jgi:hypothetical protein
MLDSSSSSTCFSYHKDKRARSGNPPDNNALPEIREQWKKVTSHFYLQKVRRVRRGRG